VAEIFHSAIFCRLAESIQRETVLIWGSFRACTSEYAATRKQKKGGSTKLPPLF
jgi:hypothetical protein